MANTLTSIILISYKKYKGIARAHWVKISGVGVTTAAITKISSKAYFLFFVRVGRDINPILAIKSKKTGSSKHIPRPKSSHEIRERASFIVIMGINPEAYANKNLKLTGSNTKYPKHAPPIKKIIDSAKKIKEYLLSCLYNPGEMNLQSWKRIKGEATNVPIRRATFR